VTLTDAEKTERVIAWLQTCFELMEAGKEDQIPANFHYESERGQLTDDYVDRIIVKIDDEFVYELEKYPDYHFRNADGANVPPEFHRLGSKARRALVEGLDRALGNEKKPIPQAS
jgi:hypothetical protein